MYIEELHYINVGPIGRADIILLDKIDAKPKPIIFVGKNGSGKSILLSNIVDCFYEIARKKYNNVVQYRDDGGYQYYKIITHQQIKIGENEMFSHIKFRQDNEQYEYIYKRSQKSKQEYTKEYGISVSDGLNWNNRDDKIINIPEDKAENSFEKGVICFFAPSRFSKPVWLGDTYFNSSDQERYSIRTHFNGILRNPIESVCETHKTLQWILVVHKSNG